MDSIAVLTEPKTLKILMEQNRYGLIQRGEKYWEAQAFPQLPTRGLGHLRLPLICPRLEADCELNNSKMIS